MKPLRKYRYSLTTTNLIPKEVTDKINELVKEVSELHSENEYLKYQINQLYRNPLNYD